MYALGTGLGYWSLTTPMLHPRSDHGVSLGFRHGAGYWCMRERAVGRCLSVVTVQDAPRGALHRSQARPF